MTAPLTRIDNAILRPIHVYQAAAADLRLHELKTANKRYPDEPYSFFSRHVRRARSIAHLIALAHFEPLTTNKESTLRILEDPELLRITLGHLVLFNADEEALRKVEMPR